MRSGAASSGGDEGTYGLAGDRTPDVSRRSQIENDNRQSVVHTERNRGRVHHFEALLEDLEIRDVIEARGGWLEHGVGGVDAVDLGPFQDDFGFDFHRPEG